jgi:hypothetical protein
LSCSSQAATFYGAKDEKMRIETSITSQPNSVQFSNETPKGRKVSLQFREFQGIAQQKAKKVEKTDVPLKLSGQYDFSASKKSS